MRPSSNPVRVARVGEVIDGKVRNIRDCVRRAREVDPGDLDSLTRDLLRQESLLLNVQRACQAAIDLAVHLGARLRGMVGFRNIAVHRYHQLDLRVLRSILDGRLDDLLRFAEIASGLAGK